MTHQPRFNLTKERKQWYWVIIEKKGNKEIYGPYTSEKEAMKYGSDIRKLPTVNSSIAKKMIEPNDSDEDQEGECVPVKPINPPSLVDSASKELFVR